MDQKIIEKPWGAEFILQVHPDFAVKLLYMKFNEMCSLQYHEKKDEYIFLLEGNLEIQIGDKKITVYPYEGIYIPHLVVHRMKALSDSTYLECSTPELDDVVRLEDIYQRI